jgi:hypothetical protein
MALDSTCLSCRAILGLRRLVEDNLPVLDTQARVLLAQLLCDVINREARDGNCSEAEYAAYVLEQAEARLGT